MRWEFGFFSEKAANTVRFKFFFKKKQQNGLAKPGYSAARGCIDDESVKSL